jgi:hypothetical protein
MAYTNVYPFRDKTAAFCRGFKTFHPLIEVAKEGLTRKGLDPQLKRIYKERVASANPSREQRLERMNERLFNAKVFFGVSCLIESIALTIPQEQEDGQTLGKCLCLMGGVAAAIWLGFMRSTYDSFKQTAPFYFAKPIWVGIGGIVSTALAIGMINSLFDGAKSLASDGISPLLMLTNSTLVIIAGIAGVLSAIAVSCIRSVFRTKLPDSNEKSGVNA